MYVCLNALRDGYIVSIYSSVYTFSINCIVPNQIVSFKEIVIYVIFSFNPFIILLLKNKKVYGKQLLSDLIIYIKKKDKKIFLV